MLGVLADQPHIAKQRLMEGLEPFEVNGGLPTDFNSLLILLTVKNLCGDELLFLMRVTEFNKYLSRKTYIHNRYSL